jgi:hypothetical protein
VARSLPATGWVDYDEKQARIYAFADLAPFRQNRDAIGRIVQATLGVAQPDPESVDLTGQSAWLTYRAPGELMTRPHPVLPSRVDALRIARDAIVKLERECSAASETWRRAIGRAPLLPPARELTEAALVAVPRPDGSAYDHWLYRLIPTLTLDGAGRRHALVLGAQVEVRIGHQGRVIALNSRWHPLSGAVKYSPIASFAPPQVAKDEDVTTSQPPSIQYVLDGDDAQQYYLAPYYARVEEHVLALYSAGPWSLTVDIGRVRQGRSTMTLLALAEGGSGDYAYHWGALPDLGLGALVDFDSGQAPQDNRSASRIELPNGAYLIVLNVLDRATGAFKHHRQIVASSPIESAGTEAMVG